MVLAARVHAHNRRLVKEAWAKKKEPLEGRGCQPAAAAKRAKKYSLRAVQSRRRCTSRCRSPRNTNCGITNRYINAVLGVLSDTPVGESLRAVAEPVSAVAWPAPLPCDLTSIPLAARPALGRTLSYRHTKGSMAAKCCGARRVAERRAAVRRRARLTGESRSTPICSRGGAP